MNGFSPEEIAAFQTKMGLDAQNDAWLGSPAGGPAPPPDLGAPYIPGAPSDAFGDRLEQSGRRMLSTPALLGIAPSGLARSMLGPESRDITSFQRPQTEELRPMATPEPQIEPSPTLAQQAAQRPGGGAGGGGGNLGGLKAAWDESRQKQLDDYGTDKRLEHRLGNEIAERHELHAALEDTMAARQMRDAELQKQADDNAAARHEAFLRRNEELADQVGAMKIDPERFIKDKGIAGQVGMAIGGMLGGYLQGQQGLASNPFLSTIDKLVDRDIAAQQSEIDNRKTQLSARTSIFGQMLQESGDRRLAAMQTRNLMYEGMKQKIAADSERLGIPEAKTNAAMAVQGIQHKQDALDEDIKKQSYAVAVQNANAAAAAQRAAEEKAWSRQMQLIELGLKKDELAIKAGEHDQKSGSVAERFVATGKDDQGNPTGYVARDAQEARAKEKQRAGAETLIQLVEEAQKIRNDQGMLGRAGARFSPVDLQYQTRLKGLKGEMTGAYKEAKQLGALDAGTQKLADEVIGDLDSIGSSSDSRLEQLKSNLRRGSEVETSSAAGQQAGKIVDPQTGREVVVLGGKFNAPRSAMPSTVRVGEGIPSDERMKVFAQKLGGAYR